MLGDKGIAVRIRSNSHCRISCFSLSAIKAGQVGMLIGLRLIKVSWAIRGDAVMAVLDCRNTKNRFNSR